eukprot:scaffold42239_cov60-Phaeocystis_antarctica.AAC.1
MSWHSEYLCDTTPRKPHGEEVQVLSCHRCAQKARQRNSHGHVDRPTQLFWPLVEDPRIYPLLFLALTARRGCVLTRC